MPLVNSLAFEGAGENGARSRRSRVHVALLIESLHNPGGSERQFVELVRGLAALGETVSVWTLEGSLAVHAPKPDDVSIPVTVIGRSGLAALLARVHPKVGQAWDMIRLGLVVRRSTPEEALVMPHHYPAHWAAAVALRRSQSMVWLCNDWIYQTQPTTSGWMRWTKAFLRRAIIAVDAAVARRCTAVLVLSRMTGADVDRGYHIRSKVFRTGASSDCHRVATPADRYAARAALGLPNDFFVVACVCILMPHRRVQDAIAALAELPREISARTLLVHAGGSEDPSLEAALRTLAEQLCVAPSVRFLGRITEDQRRSLMDACDAFVFPVEGQSWGLAPFEALAARVPVILSRSSGAAEVLRDGRHALHYVPGDVPQLARHLCRLYCDPAFRDQLAAQGHQFWARRFTWPHAARRLARALALAPRRG